MKNILLDAHEYYKMNTHALNDINTLRAQGCRVDASYYTSDYYASIYSLFESKHYSEIFEELIKDIINNKKRYLQGLIYTEWSYDNHEYSLNKNNKGHKIYVWIKTNNIKKGIRGYIRPRYEYGPNDNVEIVINDSYDIIIKSFLQHEYIHMLKMYSSDTKDNELSLKDTTDLIINNFTKDFKLGHLIYMNEEYNKRIVKLINELYIFSKTEQEASINTTCMYIKSLSKKQIEEDIINGYNLILGDDKVYATSNALSKYNQILYLIAPIDSSVHFLSRFISFVDLYKDCIRDYPDICLLIGYYLHQHNWYKSKSKYISYDFLGIVNEYLMENQNEHDILYKEIDNIELCIEEVYHEYKLKLCDALYNIMDKNKLFLCKEIAEKNIPTYDMYFNNVNEDGYITHIYETDDDII